MLRPLDCGETLPGEPTGLYCQKHLPVVCTVCEPVATTARPWDDYSTICFTNNVTYLLAASSDVVSEVNYFVRMIGQPFQWRLHPTSDIRYEHLCVIMSKLAQSYWDTCLLCAQFAD